MRELTVVKNKKYVIGADNAAIFLKREITNFLEDLGIEYEDVGVFSESDQTYYPEIARRVTDKVIESNYKKEGILICGTGIGMAITANKFPGIYAAACYDVYAAERARLSNNTNIITLGARITGPILAKKILKEWLSLEFNGGRSLPKVKKIKEYENENFRIKE